MGSTTVEFIPSIWWPALDQNPACMTLRAALVDALEESGDDLAADCMRWSLEKRRVPNVGGWRCVPEAGLAEIPRWLWMSGQNVVGEHAWMGDRFTLAFCRLIWRWSLLTPEQRKECWEWEPTA